jgi:hypothetical protein
MAEPPKDVTPPSLTQVWTSPPLMNGDIPTHGRVPRPGEGPGPVILPQPPPAVQPYEVEPGSIVTTNSLILAHTQNLIGSYESLRTYLNGVKSWIFDVSDPNYVGSMECGDSSDPGCYPYKVEDPHPEWTQEFTAISDNLLLQVADVVELAGQYVSALNYAGQLYTKADKDSFLPSMQQGMAHD